MITRRSVFSFLPAIFCLGSKEEQKDGLTDNEMGRWVLEEMQKSAIYFMTNHASSHSLWYGSCLEQVSPDELVIRRTKETVSNKNGVITYNYGHHSINLSNCHFVIIEGEWYRRKRNGKWYLED